MTIKQNKIRPVDGTVRVYNKIKSNENYFLLLEHLTE